MNPISQKVSDPGPTSRKNLNREAIHRTCKMNNSIGVYRLSKRNTKRIIPYWDRKITVIQRLEKLEHDLQDVLVSLQATILESDFQDLKEKVEEQDKYIAQQETDIF